MGLLFVVPASILIIENTLNYYYYYCLPHFRSDCQEMFYFLKLETNSYTSYIIAYQHKPYFTLREQQYKSSKI